METRCLDVAIAWHGLPFYAARLIRAGRERYGANIAVIGTRPKVPIQGIEEALGQNVTWIRDDECLNWQEIGISVPRIFFQTGWRYPAFNRLGAEVRKSGGAVVAMVDNRWRGDARQEIGRLVYRLFYRRSFNAVWVPGKGGQRLCREFGVAPESVFTGLYGADSRVFSSQKPICEREKRFLFVGQLIERKGVAELRDAWVAFSEGNPGWSLEVIGSGPLEGMFRNVRGVRVSGFLQPHELAKRLSSSRVLVLPSHEDHWGVVVHEAALSGCALLLSNAVGAAEDLVSARNGILVEPGSSVSLRKGFELLVGKEKRWWLLAERESVRMAKRFGPHRWADQFLRISEYLRNQHILA